MISISIVIPHISGRKKLLFRCIRSIQASSYKNFEIIVVDNSGNPKLLPTLNKLFPEVKIIRMPENTGIFAYSVGFTNATGNLIFALDDDCTIEKDTLRLITKTFSNLSNNVGILTLRVKTPGLDLKSDKNKQSDYPVFSFAGGACIFRKSIFAKVGYYDRDFFCWRHELDFSIRLLNAGYQIFFAKNIVVTHYDTSAKKLRRKKIFLDARNKAWINLKYFSLPYLFLLTLRDFVWIALLPVRLGSLSTFFYGFLGYVWAYVTCFVPLRKRQSISTYVQSLYLKHLLSP